jgi:hypothetical protein
VRGYVRRVGDHKDVGIVTSQISMSLDGIVAGPNQIMLVSRTQRPRRASLVGSDLLGGILQAELGAVPRALAIAGIDPADLISRTTVEVPMQ